jgi:Bacterial regulatory proteins, luxR family
MQGKRNKEIAGLLGNSEQVIKNYLRKVDGKLGVSDRLELALYCVHHQLLGEEDGSFGLSAPCGKHKRKRLDRFAILTTKCRTDGCHAQFAK